MTESIQYQSSHVEQASLSRQSPLPDDQVQQAEWRHHRVELCARMLGTQSHLRWLLTLGQLRHHNSPSVLSVAGRTRS